MSTQKPDPQTPSVLEKDNRKQSFVNRFLDSESGRTLVFLGFATLLGILGLQRLATYDETINNVRESAEERYLEERKFALEQYKNMSDSINVQFDNFSKGLVPIAQDAMEKVISDEKQDLNNTQQKFLTNSKELIRTIEHNLEPFHWLEKYKDRASSLSLPGIQSISIAYDRTVEMFSEGKPDTALQISEYAVRENLPGDTGDYFNFSTLMSRHDQTPVAADIVDLGLKHYPTDVDLIAQGIDTNKSAGRHARADDLLLSLIDISKERWPWRAFVFSGKFLMETDRIDEGLNTYAEFRKHIPGDERGYSLPATISLTWDGMWKL